MDFPKEIEALKSQCVKKNQNYYTAVGCVCKFCSEAFLLTQLAKAKSEAEIKRLKEILKVEFGRV